MSSVQERGVQIIAEQLRVDAAAITPDTHLVDDLKADSLDVVDLVIALEEEFSTDDKPLEIAEERAAELHTVRDILDFLAAQDRT